MQHCIPYARVCEHSDGWQFTPHPAQAEFTKRREEIEKAELERQSSSDKLEKKKKKKKAKVGATLSFADEEDEKAEDETIAKKPKLGKCALSGRLRGRPLTQPRRLVAIPLCADRTSASAQEPKCQHGLPARPGAGRGGEEKARGAGAAVSAGVS